MDAVFYLLDALRLFRGMSLEEIREIAFEIGMLRQFELDINDTKESHVLRALPGEGLLGTGAHLHHVCGLQAVRAGDGYRGGSGRRVGDDGETDEGGGCSLSWELMSSSTPLYIPHSYERTELHIVFLFFGHEPSSWLMRVFAVRIEKLINLPDSDLWI
jgi:hypothetical protein